MDRPSATLGGTEGQAGTLPVAPEFPGITLPPPPPTPRRTPERWPRVAGIIGAVVIVLGAIGALLWAVRGSDSEGGSVAAPTPILTASPSPVVTAFTIGGVDIRVTSATFQASWDSGFDTVYEPTSKHSILLVVTGRVDGDLDAVQEWSVAVTDENGRREEASVTATTFSADGPGKIEWVFVVPKTAHGFTLELPEGNEMDLASVLPG
jgi:hypothetical protein